MKVLIGYDGSPTADAALNDLSRAGLPNDTEVLILTAGEVWMPPPNIQVYQAAAASRRFSTTLAQLRNQAKRSVEVAEKTAEAAAARLNVEFPDWQVSSEVMTGNAGPTILRKAGEWKCDLIVVGTQNRSAIGRFFLGSVSQQIVLEAHCSVRIARGEPSREGTAVSHIVAGIDGPKSGNLIVEAIASRVWPAGSVVRLITATEDFQADAVRPFAQIFSAQEFHKQARRKLSSTGLKVRTAVKIGEAQDEVLAEAEKSNADCIFLGTRNIRGVLNRSLINSVSSDVAINASCSVEVIRPSFQQS